MARKPTHGDTEHEIEPGSVAAVSQEGDTPIAAATHAYSLADQSGGLVPQPKEITLTIASGFVQVENGQAKIKRRLTIPLLKLDVDSPDAIVAGRMSQTIFGRVVEAIHDGRVVQNAQFPTPAKLMTVEAIDGTQCKIVVSSVMQKELEAEEGYPHETYVGCWFRITKFRRAAGKKYNTFEIIEIEAPTVVNPDQRQIAAE